jgi:hypothetical protein
VYSRSGDDRPPEKFRVTIRKVAEVPLSHALTAYFKGQVNELPRVALQMLDVCARYELSKMYVVSRQPISAS